MSERFPIAAPISDRQLAIAPQGLLAGKAMGCLQKQAKT